MDDPIWLRIYPPDGWFCACHVIQRTAGWMRREGREVSPPLDLEEEAWTNKRTGETFRIPKGIYPGFDGNPGATWLDQSAEWERMTPDLTPERRLTERGLLDGMRVRTLGTGREVVVVTDRSGEPLGMATALPERPSAVDPPDVEFQPGASVLHSHPSERPLSTTDLHTLDWLPRGAIVVISPGGAIWRAVRLGEIRPAMGEFSQASDRHREELRGNPDAPLLYDHARLVFLEARGVIAYVPPRSGQVGQLLARHADRIRRMVDAVLPAP